MNGYKLSEGSSVMLDLIRGITAQVVVIGHGISFFGIFTFMHEPNFPWMQNMAVLIFFLLSGFLIGYSTTSKSKNGNNYNFIHYFIDRFSRIYTAFIPALIFVLAIDFISKNLQPESYAYENAFNLKTFIGNIFMLQDFPGLAIVSCKITSFGSARVFWTLAIEWWIYMLYGFLVLVFIKRNKINFSTIILLTFFSVVPIFNLIMGRGNGLTTYWIFGLLIYIVSGLNILEQVNKNLKIIGVLLLFGLGICRAYIQMEAYDPIFAFLLAMALWLLVDIFKDKKYSEHSMNIIKFNASFSYTLYLIHYSILSFFKTHFSNGNNPYLLFVLSFLTANVISILIGRYTEINATKRVKEFLYNKLENRNLQVLNN